MTEEATAGENPTVEATGPGEALIVEATEPGEASTVEATAPGEAPTVEATAPGEAPVITEMPPEFLEAYDCAKNNFNWQKVVEAIRNHPEWLIKVPLGRRWTMLHQIVFCGNISHLNEILALQISNPEFRLLYKARDDKTVREVAMERAPIYPNMRDRIELLVALDQLLQNAKTNKWDLVRQLLQQKPSLVNQKPPYRKKYLIHHLARGGQLDIFRELRDICTFKIGLLTEGKSVADIARENDHREFADFIESLPPDPAEPDQPDPAAAEPYHPAHPIYDDPFLMMLTMNPGGILGGHLIGDMGITVFPAPHPPPPAPALTELPPAPTMTPEEQAEYEKTIKENLPNFPAINMKDALTCSITKSIFRDPVMAADGFTYEREAILHWFQHKTTSPMTNQELGSNDIKPNLAIKSILQMIHEFNAPMEQSNPTEEKTPEEHPTMEDEADTPI